MKIMFISPGGYMDFEDYKNQVLLGTEYQFFELGKALEKNGHAVFIVRKWHEAGSERISGINVINIKSINIKKPGITLCLTKLVFSLHILTFLNKIKPDVLVIVDPITSFCSLRSDSVKVLVTHTMIPTVFLPNTGKQQRSKLLSKKVNEFFRENLFGQSDIIVALNPQIRDYFKIHGYNSMYIPNGVNISKYIPSAEEKPYILYGGRLVKEKRVDLLIKAYSLLNGELREKYRLLIIGSGSEEDNLKQYAISCKVDNNVKFIPFLPNNQFIEYVSKCCIFVLPSMYECMPVSLLEAMALKRPVIASNVPGSNTVISHGVDGFLFSKNSAVELKDYLSILLKDHELRREIGINARNKIEKTYVFDVVADQYLQLFLQYVNRPAVKETNMKNNLETA